MSLLKTIPMERSEPTRKTQDQGRHDTCLNSTRPYTDRNEPTLVSFLKTMRIFSNCVMFPNCSLGTFICLLIK